VAHKSRGSPPITKPKLISFLPTLHYKTRPNSPSSTATATSTSAKIKTQKTSKMVGIGVPICVQCGTRSNPCRCKVVGPTLGFVAFAAAAVVEWPVGALVYCFRHTKGRKIMGHPASVIYPSVTNAIPI